MRNYRCLLLFILIFFFSISILNEFCGSSVLSDADKLNYINELVAISNESTFVPLGLEPFSLSNDQLDFILNYCDSYSEITDTVGDFAKEALTSSLNTRTVRPPVDQDPIVALVLVLYATCLFCYCVYCVFFG